ncbi:MULTISPECIES: hypothetical protein [unclassified Pusillimonas]|uniref:DUF4870 family protein n=1 Tax=unclassified Pusillimonas TaxID=2640016 RepID=UPI000B9C8CE1|nr:MULTISPECIES: hypothetical protein [unclassified Pusillimonas]OXR49550.1 hypothetical protein PuT2_07065 [Pusillimonas sp. T2]ROT44321.1 hypothetical protein CHR62_13475 [Pusillimonas sp. NJUB218]
MTVDFTNPGNTLQPGNGSNPEKVASLKTITTVIYALQALSFFVGITSLVAIIINYVKLSDTKGTWLESHFRWQIRTFWYGILWCVVGFLLTFVLVGYLVLAGVVVWFIYRIVKGWLRLADNKPMYTDA